VTTILAKTRGASSNEHKPSEHSGSVHRELKRYFVELRGPAAQISEGEIEIGKHGKFFGLVCSPARINDTQLRQRSIG
jgi:hypothetical protein